MGINDVGIIGVGKDAYNSELGGMINGRVLPWVEDVQADEFPVWTDYNAAQRSTYFLNREGELIYQFNITTLDPTEPEDYEYLINLILDFDLKMVQMFFEYRKIQHQFKVALNGQKMVT